jgi:nitrate/nitrite transporter NarK
MMGLMYSSRFGTLSFGKVLGFVNLFLMLGSFGSIFSGWLFDLTKTYDYAFWIFALMLLPCIVVMWWLPPAKK